MHYLLSKALFSDSTLTPQINFQSSPSPSKQIEQEGLKLKLLDIPKVLIAKTLSFLSDTELPNAFLTCKKIYQCIDESFWKDRHSKKEHPTILSERIKKDASGKVIISRREVYIQLILEERTAKSHDSIKLLPNKVEYGIYDRDQIDTSLTVSKFIFNNSDYLNDQLKNLRHTGLPSKEFLETPSKFFNRQPLIMMRGHFSNGELFRGRTTEFDGRVLYGGFEQVQLNGEKVIIETNGRELRGIFSNGRLIEGRISRLFSDLSVTVGKLDHPNPWISIQKLGNNHNQKHKDLNISGIATDDGRILNGYEGFFKGTFPPDMLKNTKNLAAIMGAFLRALERQYEQITLPDSEGRILKGSLIHNKLFGEGRIIEADRELIGIFKNSQLKLGIICTTSTIELVGGECSSSSRTTKSSVKVEQTKRKKDEFSENIFSKEMSSLSFSTNSHQQNENSKIFPLVSHYSASLQRNGTDYTFLNGFQIKMTYVINSLEVFEKGPLNGPGIMVLPGGYKILIGEFKMGRLHTGYIVGDNGIASLHIIEGFVNFDFQDSAIDNVISDKEILVKIKKILKLQ